MDRYELLGSVRKFALGGKLLCGDTTGRCNQRPALHVEGIVTGAVEQECLADNEDLTSIGQIKLFKVERRGALAGIYDYMLHLLGRHEGIDLLAQSLHGALCLNENEIVIMAVVKLTDKARRHGVAADDDGKVVTAGHAAITCFAGDEALAPVGYPVDKYGKQHAVEHKHTEEIDKGEDKPVPVVIDILFITEIRIGKIDKSMSEQPVALGGTKCLEQKSQAPK